MPARKKTAKKSASAPAASSSPAWPSYQGTAQLVGNSPSGKVTVYVDPSLGQQALQNAQDLLSNADSIVTSNNGFFGTTGGAVSAIIFALGGATDGTGGADHMGCDYVNGNAIEVDASYGNSSRVYGLFEAELSECSMNGNLCGESTGEALSRWCAALVSNNALADFATAPQWAQDGMADWVDKVEDTDQDGDSIGCGMAFLSWLMSTGSSLDKIAPAMVALGDLGTLAQLYAKLSGDSASNAWSKFQTAIKALPNGVTSDDPFGAFTSAVPAKIPAQLAPGTAETQAPTLASGPARAKICPPKSKRLLPPKMRVR